MEGRLHPEQVAISQPVTQIARLAILSRVWLWVPGLEEIEQWICGPSPPFQCIMPKTVWFVSVGKRLCIFMPLGTRSYHFWWIKLYKGDYWDEGYYPLLKAWNHKIGHKWKHEETQTCLTYVHRCVDFAFVPKWSLRWKIRMWGMPS